MTRHRDLFSHLALGALALGLVAFAGCQKAGDASGDPKQAASAPPVPSSCVWDEDCKSPKHICMYERCVKGERTEEARRAIAEQRKADEEKARAKIEADRPPGPDEGRLMVRICPFVKRTAALTSWVVAKNKATGKEYTLKLEELFTRGMDWQSEFLFKKLPLGEYEVTADYGIKTPTGRDVVRLLCDKKAKPCSKDKMVRTMTVVPIGQEPPPKLDKEGKVEKKACDWIAE